MVDRRARGAFYTPDEVARHLIGVALDGRPRPRSVCDPAAGDGRLLRAVSGVVDGARLFGADLHAPTPRGLPPSARWSRADTLVGGLAAWPDAPVEGFDLVVGNPPFRNQLERETLLSEDERAAVQSHFGEVARGYADVAAMFLVAACEMAAPTGRVALIMPLSFLAARDAGPARRRVLELAALDGLWVATTNVFPDAAVSVCAVILDRAGPRRRMLRRWMGERFDPLPPVEVDSDALMHARSWSHLAAAAFGVPEVELDTSGRLGDLATTTAGFRDEFYGLAPLVVEADGSAVPPAPLVTSGLIEPGRVVWGERAARMGGRTWTRPAVDLGALEPEGRLARWVAARRLPKLVVATQTRVVEAAPDPGGTMVPSTPVIAVHAEGEDLWRALAVLLAPPVSAWALQHCAGTARSAGAIKLSATSVAEVPLPVDVGALDAAARELRRAHDRGGIDGTTLADLAPRLTAAYGCDRSVTAWWNERWRPSGSSGGPGRRAAAP